MWVGGSEVWIAGGCECTLGYAVRGVKRVTRRESCISVTEEEQWLEGSENGHCDCLGYS